MDNLKHLLLLVQKYSGLWLEEQCTAEMYKTKLLAKLKYTTISLQPSNQFFESQKKTRSQHVIDCKILTTARSLICTFLPNRMD